VFDHRCLRRQSTDRAARHVGLRAPPLGPSELSELVQRLLNIIAAFLQQHPNPTQMHQSYHQVACQPVKKTVLRLSLTLSMAACRPLRSTPEAAEDEAAAARHRRRGPTELAVGATSTATIAIGSPCARGSAADRQR